MYASWCLWILYSQVCLFRELYDFSLAGGMDLILWYISKGSGSGPPSLSTSSPQYANHVASFLAPDPPSHPLSAIPSLDVRRHLTLHVSKTEYLTSAPSPAQQSSLYSSHLSKCQKSSTHMLKQTAQRSFYPLLSFISHMHSMSVSWEPDVPKLWDLVPDDLRESCCNNNNRRKKNIQ